MTRSTGESKLAHVMKRNRTMLLCVTATSMAAAVGCTTTHPVGGVSQPHEPATVDTATSPDATPVAVSKRDAAPATTPDGPDELMGPRVGTTANAPDR